jgi:phosphoribosyl-AMP cyclohydrolase
MDFSKLDGLIPAVVQDHVSGEVLMVGFMNQEAWDITRRTGYVTFFSRTRNTLWTKGETSGNKLAVREVLIDCDDDTVLVKAERLGDGNVCRRKLPTELRHIIEDMVGGRVGRVQIPQPHVPVVARQKKAWENALGGEEAAQPYIQARLVGWPKRSLADTSMKPREAP